jgi:1-acyl-sn-glycerol-3-phosphate acyltransferase
VVLLTAIIAVLAPLQCAAALLSGGRMPTRLPALFHRLACRVMGVVVDVRGAMNGGQTVWISNHLSYLDIMAIGSVARCSFVAKDDVRGWPVFGLLARLQDTVFISRTARRAADVGQALALALAGGRNLVVFPEGTTSDGAAVLPFKSSLFEVFVADPTQAGLTLQPLTVSIESIDGHAVDVANRDLYAYHGDASLGPHLLRFLGTKGAKVRLTFHAPLSNDTTASRKTLAHAAHVAVAGGLVASG